MDFDSIKELLPFLFFIIIGIVGSLSKKKSGNKGTSGKNVFEKMLDELNGENTKKVVDPSVPETLEEDWEEEPAYAFEQVEERFAPVPEASSVTPAADKVKPTSLLEAYKQRKESMQHGKSWAPLEVIDLDEAGHRVELQLNNPDEVKKAVLYSEILKPRYF